MSFALSIVFCLVSFAGGVRAPRFGFRQAAWCSQTSASSPAPLCASTLKVYSWSYVFSFDADLDGVLSDLDSITFAFDVVNDGNLTGPSVDFAIASTSPFFAASFSPSLFRIPALPPISLNPTAYASFVTIIRVGNFSASVPTLPPPSLTLVLQQLPEDIPTWTSSARTPMMSVRYTFTERPAAAGAVFPSLLSPPVNRYFSLSASPIPSPASVGPIMSPELSPVTAPAVAATVPEATALIGAVVATTPRLYSVLSNGPPVVSLESLPSAWQKSALTTPPYGIVLSSVTPVSPFVPLAGGSGSVAGPWLYAVASSEARTSLGTLFGARRSQTDTSVRISADALFWPAVVPSGTGIVVQVAVTPPGSSVPAEGFETWEDAGAAVVAPNAAVITEGEPQLNPPYNGVLVYGGTLRGAYVVPTDAPMSITISRNIPAGGAMRIRFLALSGGPVVAAVVLGFNATTNAGLAVFPAVIPFNYSYARSLVGDGTCAAQPCDPVGTLSCSDDGTHYRCLCLADYEGVECDVPISASSSATLSLDDTLVFVLALSVLTVIFLVVVVSMVTVMGICRTKRDRRLITEILKHADAIAVQSSLGLSDDNMRAGAAEQGQVVPDNGPDVNLHSLLAGGGPRDSESVMSVRMVT
eukprot:TRINITY_DN45330_c0_g1_i1.p1 TRINITY_DN45330_c0_g1~~TRINITY_DN45330_c0_g1_i1.p1  ORF type:complete len:641 (+),score=62.72 TRINITY_DN45330_c0_g1_i1:46-1968(+)